MHRLYYNQSSKIILIVIIHRALCKLQEHDSPKDTRHNCFTSNNIACKRSRAHWMWSIAVEYICIALCSTTYSVVPVKIRYTNMLLKVYEFDSIMQIFHVHNFIPKSLYEGVFHNVLQKLVLVSLVNCLDHHSLVALCSDVVYPSVFGLCPF